MQHASHDKHGQGCSTASYPYQRISVAAPQETLQPHDLTVHLLTATLSLGLYGMISAFYPRSVF